MVLLAYMSPLYLYIVPWPKEYSPYWRCNVPDNKYIYIPSDMLLISAHFVTLTMLDVLLHVLNFNQLKFNVQKVWKVPHLSLFTFKRHTNFSLGIPTFMIRRSEMNTVLNYGLPIISIDRFSSSYAFFRYIKKSYVLNMLI